MAIEMWDGTCRGKDAGRIHEAVSRGDGCRYTIAELMVLLNRGTIYLREIVDETPELEFASKVGRVRDWTVGCSNSVCRGSNANGLENGT